MGFFIVNSSSIISLDKTKIEIIKQWENFTGYISLNDLAG